MHQQFRSKDPLRCYVGSFLKLRQTTSSTLSLFTELNVLPQKTDWFTYSKYMLDGCSFWKENLFPWFSWWPREKNICSGSVSLYPSQLQKSFLTWSSTHVSNASFPGTLLWAQTSSVQNQPKTTWSVSKPFLCTFSLCLLLAEQQPTIFLLSSFCCQFTLTSLSQLQLSLDCCQLKQCFSLPTKYFSYLYLLSAPSFFFFLTHPEILCN